MIMGLGHAALSQAPNDAEQHRRPPPEAIAACKSASSGAQCSFSTEARLPAPVGRPKESPWPASRRAIRREHPRHPKSNDVTRTVRRGVPRRAGASQTSPGLGHTAFQDDTHHFSMFLLQAASASMHEIILEVM
jgi:hypothetical protein